MEAGFRIWISVGFAVSESLDPDTHFDPDPKFFLNFFREKIIFGIRSSLTYGSGSAYISNPGSGCGSA